MGFEDQKKNFLSRTDKSRKKAIDKDIASLVGLINKRPDYYTTSSCSGRIVLLAGSGKKQSGWIYSTHSKAVLKHVKDALKDISGKDIWFRQEPMILHVCCRTLDDARKLLNVSRKCFKRAGIIALNKRIILEIIGTDTIITPITKKGKTIIQEPYLKYLIDEANKKLRNNKKKIEKFYNLLKDLWSFP